MIVDYVQLIEPMRRERGENRVQEIDSILKQLRAIAKQFNCAVLGLAQLKREVDSRSEKRPTKADFRESGGFEQETAAISNSQMIDILGFRKRLYGNFPYNK
ncbi:MAG: hypothetical protein KME55_41460 [Nostoc indistinguendum CM1-VF10]|jgi:replicative DNA helicase|nr:hypothetical protein [Nostoc indistinguendum CM1-VF10]